jgi:hypothetical protein
LVTGEGYQLVKITTLGRPLAMTDTPDIRSDSATTPTEALAATTTATDAEAVATPPVETVATAAAGPIAESVSAPEVKVAPERSPIAGSDAAPAGILPAWIGRIGGSVIPSLSVSRGALVACGIGVVAGMGILAGTVAFLGVGRLTAAPTPGPAPWTKAADETRVLKQAVGKLEAQVSSLKASIDTSNRHANTQQKQIVNRYEQGVRTQNEMQTRLVKIGDAVERLEKRVAAVVAAEATGSVAPRYAAAAAGAVQQQQQQQQQQQLPQTQAPAVVAAVEPKAPAEPPVVAGWTIRDVFRGRALVANRRGVFEAAPGLHLPELGRVEAVTRRNGRWVVVTEKGLITMSHRPRAARGYDAD